ncbi:MAG: HAMP domain-containing protein [Burkholderiaceae bacterium]|nr:HAMP domain-containing protein [Burkholderiaceae bacterium]
MRISLFWRTFLLIATLVAASLFALLGLLRILDRAPPQQRLAWEIASVVNLTRSALVSSQPERRLSLLRELARDEGVRVLPLEASDQIDLDRGGRDVDDLRNFLAGLLGPDTLTILGRVNGRDGLWISFEIDGDGYWLHMRRSRIERHLGPGISVVLAIASALSLLGALVLSRLVNQPLAKLSSALTALSRGESPPPLKEHLVSEISEVNRRFNEMAHDLRALDADRSIALAGISHDIRSPLARLRIEVEMAGLSDVQRDSMVDDIDRIDRIVGQFVEFARVGSPSQVEEIQCSQVLTELASTYRAQIATNAMQLELDAPAAARWTGSVVDLRRALGNLIDNALAYGRSQDGIARIAVRARRVAAGITLEVTDDGPGVPSSALEKLLRPFERLDTARGTHEGAGLGLAIVERMARRYDGRLRLENRKDGGLSALLFLHDARSAAPVAAKRPRA